jgi:hypothetical protein
MAASNSLTERERRVIDLAVEWRRETRTVAGELRWLEFLRELDMLLKAHRDSHTSKPQK